VLANLLAQLPQYSLSGKSARISRPPARGDRVDVGLHMVASSSHPFPIGAQYSSRLRPLALDYSRGPWPVFCRFDSLIFSDLWYGMKFRCALGLQRVLIRRLAAPRGMVFLMKVLSPQIAAHHLQVCRHSAKFLRKDRGRIVHPGCTVTPRIVRDLPERLDRNRCFVGRDRSENQRSGDGASIGPTKGIPTMGGVRAGGRSSGILYDGGVLDGGLRGLALSRGRGGWGRGVARRLDCDGFLALAAAVRSCRVSGKKVNKRPPSRAFFLSSPSTQEETGGHRPDVVLDLLLRQGGSQLRAAAPNDFRLPNRSLSRVALRRSQSRRQLCATTGPPRRSLSWPRPPLAMSAARSTN